MDNLKRLKSLTLFIGLCALPVLAISFYSLGVYVALSDCLNDISTLLDVAKW